MTRVLDGTSLAFRAHRHRRHDRSQRRHASRSRSPAASPRLSHAEADRAAARHPADDHRDPARGDGGAGRDDAARRAAQRRGHHVPGRRRRRAGRRSADDPRLQRAHRHVRRRRARLRRLLARFVQPRTGRSGQGPDLVARRPRVDRRRDQPGQQGAEPQPDRRRDHRRRQRELPALDHRHQPAARELADSGHRRFASTRCGPTPTCRAATASSRRAGAWRRRSAFGVGTPTRATRQLLQVEQDNLPEYGLPWVPANTNPELAAYANGIPPVDQTNFYGLVARDYEKTDTDLATVDVARDFGDATDAPQPDALGPERSRLGDHRAALRRVNTSTAHQPAAAVARHDRRHRRRTRPTSRRGLPPAAVGHAIAAGVEFAIGELA